MLSLCAGQLIKQKSRVHFYILNFVGDAPNEILTHKLSFVDIALLVLLEKGDNITVDR